MIFSIRMKITRLVILFCFRSPSSISDYRFVNHLTNGTVVSTTLTHAPLTTYKLPLTMNSNIIDWPNVRKLQSSSSPPLLSTFMKNDIPNMANMNMTKNNSRHMLNNAGSDMARANRRVLMPFAPLTRRNTRPTLATRTTRNSVGDTKYLEIKSLSTRPVSITSSGETKAVANRERGNIASEPCFYISVQSL